MEKIQIAGANFRSLTESIDTTSPAGRLIMQMIGSFAEFERSMLRERTRNGLHAARKQGRIGERRQKLKKDQKEEVVQLTKNSSRCSQALSRSSLNNMPIASRYINSSLSTIRSFIIVRPVGTIKKVYREYLPSFLKDAKSNNPLDCMEKN